jgi:F-type H+-transporting ATPase subunit b
MNVDIQQILTHVVGFLIALWILRRFAWRPLLELLEERRRKIKADFDAAAEKREAAEETAARYEAQMKNIEADARAKLQEAVGDGRRIAAEIREEARGEARKIIDKARADLVRDVAKAKVELRDQLISMTIVAAERMVRQELDQEGHRKLIAGFIDEMEGASATQKG